MRKGNQLLFSDRSGYREFSRYWLAPFSAYRYRPPGARSLVPAVFRSVEHYFQAEKFRQCAPQLWQRILDSMDPDEVRALSEAQHELVRADWSEVQDRVMWVALWLKFTQHRSLAQMLLGTSPYRLVETSLTDAYWGWGPNHDGENRMGAMLERLRERLLRADQQMRVVVAGSRNFMDRGLVARSMAYFFRERWPDEIVCGDAPGSDTLGELWAQEHFVPVVHFPAHWERLDAPGAVVRTRADGTKYNARAGLDRNRQMAEYATHAILFWDGKSTGTADMHRHCRALGIQVRVVRI